MNPNKIPYSANRKVCWEDGYNTAIEEVEKIINELKCYCELCFFAGKHDSDKDKLINVLELKKQLKQLKEKN